MNKKYINNNRGKGSKTRRKSAPNRKVVIYDDIPERKEYICQFCNYNTVLRLDQLSLYCNHCHNISLIEDLQEVQHLEPPKTLDNFEPAISTTPMPTTATLLSRRNLSIANLSDKGIKITSYDVRDGSGKPMYEDE
jgi:hypothetical protein